MIIVTKNMAYAILKWAENYTEVIVIFTFWMDAFLDRYG